MLDARARESETGETLQELERRQDDVLSQLEDLDLKLSSILRGLGVNLSENVAEENPSIRLADLGDDGEENESFNESPVTEDSRENAEPLRFEGAKRVASRKAA